MIAVYYQTQETQITQVQQLSTGRSAPKATTILSCLDMSHHGCMIYHTRLTSFQI